MGSKHLECRTRNEDNPTDIQKFKYNFGYEEICDNRPSSNILNNARTNTLQLNDRDRHTNKEINCMVCDKDEKS